MQKVFLEITRNSQQNTCARVSFLINLQSEAANLLRKILWHRCFPVNCAKFLRTPFFIEHIPLNTRLPQMWVEICAFCFQITANNIEKSRYTFISFCSACNTVILHSFNDFRDLFQKILLGSLKKLRRKFQYGNFLHRMCTLFFASYLFPFLPFLIFNKQPLDKRFA